RWSATRCASTQASTRGGGPHRSCTRPATAFRVGWRIAHAARRANPSRADLHRSAVGLWGGRPRRQRSSETSGHAHRSRRQVRRRDPPGACSRAGRRDRPTRRSGRRHDGAHDGRCTSRRSSREGHRPAMRRLTRLALLPPVAAGVVIFRLPAVEMLGVAVAAGIAGIVASRLVWSYHVPNRGASPLIAAVFGVALVGAGASLAISIGIAVLAVVLEVLRARYMPAIRAQLGLLGYAAVALVTRGGPSAHVNPANGAPFG